MIYWPAKAPGEVEDFAFDFTGLLATGESIVSHTVTATGVTIDSESESGGIVTAVISGGTLGTPGVVTCEITTDGNPARTYSETAILPISEEAVSLDMAKRQCRIELSDTSEDGYLLELIQAAREHAEQYCGIAILPKSVQMTFATFAGLDALTRAPLQSVTSIAYLDSAGVEQTLDPSIYETFNADSDPLRPKIRLAYNQSWPSIRCASDAVRVNATVGYTVTPRPLIRAMLLLINQWFDNRSAVAVDIRGTPTSLPNTVEALLSNFRRF
jgi:uncharacterized phiE125 gp8 family phage protein